MSDRSPDAEHDEPGKGPPRAAPPSPSSRPSLRNAGLILVALLLTGIAVARIASTYTVLSSTVDEPSHMVRGMEWLAKGTYSYVHHPPLAPVAIGLGPYLDGVRIEFKGDKGLDRRAVLHARDTPVRNLTLARIGVLPFLLLAIACVWWWSRRLFGDAVAFVATVLFTTLPPILAHSGLAMTDIAITATFALALLAFTSWLERPTLARGAAFGVAAGLALLSKISALAFLPAGALAIVAIRWVAKRRQAERAVPTAGARVRSLGLGALVAFTTLWGGYQFSVGSPAAVASPWGTYQYPLPTSQFPDPQPYRLIDYVFGAEGTLHDIADGVVELPALPAPEYVLGILSVTAQQVRGNAGYFLGEIRHNQGSWLFFPVVLGVKTPLAFLILTGLGIYVLLRQFWAERDWRRIAPLAAAVAILLFVLPSDVNSGVRHILPIYPLLAMVAAYGTVRFWKIDKHRALARVTTATLVTWHLVSSAAVHPDYLAYFNELAGDHPERILVRSDLAWGQDVKRLADELRARNIDEVHVSVHGGHSVRRQEMPRVTKQLYPNRPGSRPPTGWIAIGWTKLKENSGYSWLEFHKPVTTVGRSIRLYYIPPPRRLSLRFTTKAALGLVGADLGPTNILPARHVVGPLAISTGSTTCLPPYATRTKAGGRRTFFCD